ncbi:MAG TPA: hypothetical protein VK853_04380 [Ilumatobacteraceae bacterium]|nr:hypothetical protein [Ilumatobacteraceae bacterium]
MAAFVIISIAVPALYLWLMVRRPTDRSVAAFATTYAVVLTPHNVDQVRRYIQWARRWRAGATVVLVVASSATAYAIERDPVVWWLPIVIGYAVGTLAGELLRPVERRADRASASLEPRRVRDFVVPHFLVAVGVVFVASLLPAIFLLLDNPQRSWSSTTDSTTNAVSRPQDWFVVALALTSIGAAVVATAGARALARAPIPADTPDRLAVRHAIRSAAIMALIGASVMVSGAVGAKLAGSAVLLDGDAPLVVRVTNGLGVGIGALGALWGAMLTLTTIPRLGLFSRHLPPVPAPEAPGAA